MNKLYGKTILFLEGENMLIPVLEKAHSFGIKTVIANWYSPEDAPAKLVADKHYEVDFNDIPQMLEIIENEKVDGIFTAFTDSHMDAFYRLCNAAKLPCYTNEKLLEVMVNKATFKKYCQQAGLKVIEEYSKDIFEDSEKRKDIQYPVIVKPVDNSGARGISIVFDDESLESAVKRGLEYSTAKDVVIERYIRAEYALADFMIQDGKAYFCASSDKPVNDDDKTNVVLPGAYIYPSKHDSLIKEKLIDAVQRFVEIIGYENGIMCLELIVEDGNVYVIEPQFRYGGKFQDVFIEEECGLDEIEDLLKLSVFGRYGEDGLAEKIADKFKRNYALMNILVGKGIISSMPTLEEINKIADNGVSLYIPRKQIGDEIIPDGSVIQMFGKVVVTDNTRGSLLAKMKSIQQKLLILNENGENIVINSMPENYS